MFSKYLKEQVMDIIDNDKKIKHSKIAEGVENAIQVTKLYFIRLIKTLSSDVRSIFTNFILFVPHLHFSFQDKKFANNLDTSQLDACYPAIIQSGGNYKLKFSVNSDKENVHFGAIVW